MQKRPACHEMDGLTESSLPMDLKLNGQHRMYGSTKWPFLSCQWEDHPKINLIHLVIRLSLLFPRTRPKPSNGS